MGFPKYHCPKFFVISNNKILEIKKNNRQKEFILKRPVLGFGNESQERESHESYFHVLIAIISIFLDSLHFGGSLP